MVVIITPRRDLGRGADQTARGPYGRLDGRDHDLRKTAAFRSGDPVRIVYVEPTNLSDFNPSGLPLLQASAALAPVTMFVFLGLESATVPAGDVRDPVRTIPRSTVLGISIAAVLYVLGTIAVMGLIPRQQLVHSLAPFSEAARVMWGPPGEIATSLAVVLSSVGALNGWTLLM